MDTITIQVEKDTLEMLNSLKKEIDAESYDDTIRWLFRKSQEEG